MRFLTCYKVLEAGSIQGGLGQGGGQYWTDDVGILLQEEIASLFGAELVRDPRPHGRDSYDVKRWAPPAGDFDVAYVQLFDIPNRRPGRFVWSMISDYVGMENVLEAFLAAVGPNLLISLQYPLSPPGIIDTMPTLRLQNLVQQCAKYGCDVVYLPWFNRENVPNRQEVRTIPAMCTGKISGTYPRRDAVFRHLEKLRIPGAIVSGNPEGSDMKLSTEEYREALYRCRYYFTGGIYDFQIAPKYYEICNYGACLVTFPLPMLEESGFINDQTCIVIESLAQVQGIIESPLWRRIGPCGRRMVQMRHNMKWRARDIAEAMRKRGVA